MLSISDGETLSRALTSTIDASTKSLLRLRSDQFGGDITDHARFVIVQPPDTLTDVEQELGFSIDEEHGHGPEWAESHGSIVELCWIFTDDGFAHVLIVPEAEDIDPALLELCRSYVSEQA